MTIDQTYTVDTTLALVPVADLMTKAFELTHSIGELEASEHRAHRVGLADHKRAERDAIVREMQRRSDGMERALVVAEAAERTMRFVDTILLGADTSDPAAGRQAVMEARVALDLMIDRTTNTTCSLVKHQSLSDQISHKARDLVRPIREAVRAAKVPR